MGLKLFMAKSVEETFARVFLPGEQPVRTRDKINATALHSPKKQRFMLIRRGAVMFPYNCLITPIAEHKDVRICMARRLMCMQNIKNVGIAFSIAAISVAAVCLSQNRSVASDANPIEKASPAPGWELQDLDGKTVRLSDFKGKVVILDFWATWCPPCRAEIPGFIELQKKYQAQGLAIVGVSVDQASSDTVS
jgi:hypothetical protein